MLRVLTTLTAVVLLLAAAAAPASARTRLKPPWATVNICDTESFPDRLGVRASMPGDGTRARMYMRFTAQFFDRRLAEWRDAEGRGTSRWIYVGSARFLRREAGYSFRFEPPPGDEASFVLRGVVDFQWRERKRARRGAPVRTVVTRRGRKTTRAGHRSSGGTADPDDYSSGLCEITR